MESPRYLSKSSADLQRIFNQITRHSLNLFTSRTNPHVMLMLPPLSHKDGSQHTTCRAAMGLLVTWEIYGKYTQTSFVRGLQGSWGWNEKGLTKFKRPVYGSCSAKQLLTPHWQFLIGTEGSLRALGHSAPHTEVPAQHKGLPFLLFLLFPLIKMISRN